MGRGSSKGLTIRDRLAGARVELDYALTKRNEYGNVPYGGTKQTRERFEMWSNEVRRLNKLVSDLEAKQTRNKTKINDAAPF